MRAFAVAAALVLSSSTQISGQSPSSPAGSTSDRQTLCPRATLPAYAHNDYENKQPLVDALRLGFRGVEADVFLINGRLRVGHDLRTAQSGGSLEELYLEPLRALVARCGVLTADGRPFLLALELKQASHPAYDTLLRTLERYRGSLTPGSRTTDAAAPVEVVLVGWHPSLSALQSEKDGLVRLQHRMTRPDDTIGWSSRWVRLVSVDYRKTMGRPWISPAARRRWLVSLRESKRAAPARLLRVHNLPADSALYDALLHAGVDLIGTKELVRTRQLLHSLTPTPRASPDTSRTPR